MGVHPVHLCRTFSEHFDCTLGEYIRRLRVLRGRQLLAIDDGGLAEIALQSGFADQSHFTRVFKKHFGLTPNECRRRPIWVQCAPRLQNEAYDGHGRFRNGTASTQQSLRLVLCRFGQKVVVGLWVQLGCDKAAQGFL